MKKITQELQGMGTGDGKRGRNFWRKGVPDWSLVELLKSRKESDLTERLNSSNLRIEQVHGRAGSTLPRRPQQGFLGVTHLESPG